MSEPSTDETLVLPFTPEVKAKVEADIDDLRKRNGTVLLSIRRMGADLDFTTAMVTTYFEVMVELGMITEDQWLALQLAWEERFAHQLRGYVSQLEQQIEKQRIASALGAPAGPSQLFVPGRG